MSRRNVKVAAFGVLVVALVSLVYFASRQQGNAGIWTAVHGEEEGSDGGRSALFVGLDGGTPGDGNRAGAGNKKKNRHGSGCAGVDTRGIATWKRGQVTELQPTIAKNCEKLKLGVPQEQASVRLALSSWAPKETEEEFRGRMTNCPQVWSEFSERNFYNSANELEFPIAYTMVFHNNTRQVVRLLKVLWRPQNVICLHPDAKQSAEFVSFFRDFASCFDNVFVASKLEKVVYAHHTIMDAQLNCMHDLMRLDQPRWRYVITLCGTELPLKTNREIVTGLKRLKGGSGITTHAMDDNTKSRFNRKIAVGPNDQVRFTSTSLGPPPHGIELRKSWDFFALTRAFVNFILTDQRAIDFRSYCREVYIPEEHFFASLYWMRDAPDGEFLRDKSGVVPLVSDMVWVDQKDRKRGPHCAGQVVHGICILSSGDLGTVYTKGILSHTYRFFYNKYFMHLDHVVMDCMEERLVQQNKMEYIQDCLL